MKLRFQADADLNHVIVLAVVRREPEVDFQPAGPRLVGLSDDEVLALAADERRLLVSHDQRTMPAAFARFVAAGSSAGLIIVPQHLPVAAAVEDLLLLWHATEPDEWKNRIAFLPL